MKIETQVQLFSETLSGFISALNKAKWDYNIDEGYDENNKRAVAEPEKVLERTRKVEAEIGNCTYEPLTLESEGSE